MTNLSDREQLKECKYCDKQKPLTEFRLYKSGKSAGYYSLCCKVCANIKRKEYQRIIAKERPWIQKAENLYNKQWRIDKDERDPWYKHYCYAYSRCRCKTRYKQRGIKFLITGAEVKAIWFRDKAYLLTKPSLDRIDGTKDYTPENCRFVELSENLGSPKCVRNYPKERPWFRKAVKQYTLNGEFIKEFVSIMQAERELGVDRSSITAVCKHRHRFTTGGFIWKYKIHDSIMGVK